MTERLYKRFRIYYSLAIASVLFLCFFLAYPKITSIETMYLKGVMTHSFDKGHSGLVYYLSNATGITNFTITHKAREYERHEISVIEKFEQATSSYKVSYEMTKDTVTKNNKLISTIIKEGLVLHKSGKEKYELIKSDRIPISDIVFEHENISGIESKNPNDQNYQPVHLTKKERKSNLREIEYAAFVSEDYSANKSNSEILDEILFITISANQYLRPIGFRLILKGIKIYRGNSPFTDQIKSRNPRSLLNKLTDEHHRNKTPERQLSVLFSDTHMPGAHGLSYPATSCVNPRYSGIIITNSNKNISRYITSPATLAHEVGHFLGMGHDNKKYPNGPSLMSTRVSMLPFGFSDNSIKEQLNHSDFNKPGGKCFKYQYSQQDSDHDGVSDLEEEVYGSKIEDPGSKPKISSKTNYTIWNGFINQVGIGEINNTSSLESKVKIDVYDLNGKEKVKKEVSIRGFSQTDVLFNELLPEFMNNYGIVKLTSNAQIMGRTNIYAHKGIFNQFNYISTHPFFLPIKTDKISNLSFNSLVPFGFQSGSKVHNWLSIVNVSLTKARFIVETYSSSGEKLKTEVIQIPSYGRRDVFPAEAVSSLSGHFKIIPHKDNQNNNYFSFLSRYYESSDQQVTGSSYQEGKIATGEKKYLIRKNIKDDDALNSETWLEITNTSNKKSTIQIKTVSNNKKRALKEKYEISANSQKHINIQGKELKIITISEINSNPFIVSGFTYKGMKDQSSVETLPVHEIYYGEKSTSVNSFLDTTSKLLIGNPEKKNAILYCTIRYDGHDLQISRKLGETAVWSYSFKELFPKFPKDSYAHLKCHLETPSGQPVRSHLVLERNINQKHKIQTHFN